MQVKCINDKGSIQLIKDKIYTVNRIRRKTNYGHSHHIILPQKRYYMYIKGISNVVYIEDGHFANLDGSPIELKEYGEYTPTFLSPEDIEIGDSLECTSNNLKSITFGKIYTVKEIFGYNVSLNEAHKTLKSGEIKYPLLSIYNFKKIPKDISRGIELDNILYDKIDERKTNYDVPTIERNDRIVYLLKEFSIAYKFLKDTEMPDTSIMEVIIRRNRNKKFITEEDFKILDTLNWSDILYEK